MATGALPKPSFDLNSFPQPQNIISNTDFNNMVQSGVYLMTGGMTNSPYGGGYGMLIVLCNDYSSSSSQHKVRQIFIPESTDSVFIRKKHTGAWGSWVQASPVRQIYSSLISATFNSGATSISLPGMVNGNVVVTNQYKGSATSDQLTCIYTVQPIVSEQRANIYIRKPDGTLPANGTTFDMQVMWS